MPEAANRLTACAVSSCSERFMVETPAGYYFCQEHYDNLLVMMRHDIAHDFHYFLTLRYVFQSFNGGADVKIQ